VLPVLDKAGVPAWQARNRVTEALARQPKAYGGSEPQPAGRCASGSRTPCEKTPDAGLR
jgi:hypothetical protein